MTCDDNTNATDVLTKVIISVDGELHEYSADSFVGFLEYEKDARIINIDDAHDSKTGGYVVSFDAAEVPERIIVGTYKPPFYGAVFVRESVGTCGMEYGGDVMSDTERSLGVYFCSECGSPIYNDCMPRYCCYCGKAVSR